MTKKTVLRLSIFIISVIVIDSSLGYLFDFFRYKVKSGTIFCTNYGLQKCTEKILIIGASEVKHSFISQQLEDSIGLSCYNLGLDGHNIYYHYSILNEILKRYTPDIVIISTAIIAEDKSTLSTLFPYRQTYPDINKTVLNIEPLEKYKLLSKTYTNNSLIIKIMLGMMRDNDPHKGYKPLYGGLENVGIDTTKRDFKFSSATLKYFGDAIKIAKSSGSKVVIVTPPTFSYKSPNHIPADLQNVFSEYDVDYLDYCNDTTFLNNPDYFYDKSHLNNIGASIFTTKFTNDFESLNFKSTTN